MLERIEVIESLHSAIEATIEQDGGEYVVTALRLADDGWAGWSEQTRHVNRDTAVSMALQRVKNRIFAEAQRRV